MNIYTVKHEPVQIPTAWRTYLTQNWHVTRDGYSGIRERRELSVRWLLKEFPDITDEEKEQVQLWVDDNLVPFGVILPQIVN